jgi:hypothetical protein
MGAQHVLAIAAVIVQEIESPGLFWQTGQTERVMFERHVPLFFRLRDLPEGQVKNRSLLVARVLVGNRV